MAFQGTLTGNLGMKPELITFNSGKMKTELRVAIRQQDKDAPAFWVQVDLWEKSAQYAADYLNIGDTIYAQGTIKEETFTRRNGEAGHKVVLQYARIELLKSATPKQQTTPTNQSTQDDQVRLEDHNNRKAGIYPEVDQIPF